MSEYQYYEFLAVDSPLSDDARAALRGISTRARITATSFTNEYHWGDLHADPLDLLQRFFDVHVYVANWGSRTFAVRLPKESLPAAARKAYLLGAYVGVRTKGAYAVVALHAEDEEVEQDWDDGGEWMASLAPVRTELLAGDARPLYLAWLLAVQAGEVAASGREPPVPPGLGSRTSAQDALVSFLRLDPHLLDVAAEASGDPEDALEGLPNWIRELDPKTKDRLLLRVAGGEPEAVRSELHAGFAKSRRNRASPEAGGRRTAGALLEAAEVRREAAAERELRRRARERKRREAREAAARKAHLDALEKREPHAWRKVERLVRERAPKTYDAAVSLLCDLHDLAARRADGLEAFERRVGELRRRHARKVTLIARLDDATGRAWTR